jgi:hypothetical protein
LLLRSVGTSLPLEQSFAAGARPRIGHLADSSGADVCCGAAVNRCAQTNFSLGGIETAIATWRVVAYRASGRGDGGDVLGVAASNEAAGECRR